MDSGSYQELQELELELYTTIAPFLKNIGQIQRSNAPLVERKFEMQNNLKDKLEEIKFLIEDIEAQSNGYKDRTQQATAYPIEIQILAVYSLSSSLQGIKAAHKQFVAFIKKNKIKDKVLTNSKSRRDTMHPEDKKFTQLNIKDVCRILKNFESAMKRWACRDKKRWSIDNEYDVQNILFLILRSYFDDLIYEEPIGKLGHVYSKVDFRIPSIGLLIEAKYARDSKDFSKIENQIKEDIINYLNVSSDDKLVIFIFDDSSSVQDHQITIKDFRKFPQIADVIIVSRPSHIKK